MAVRTRTLPFQQRGGIGNVTGFRPEKTVRGDAGVQTTFESQQQRTMKPRTMLGKMPCASRNDRRCVADTWHGKKNPSLGMVCVIRNGRRGKDIPRKMGQPHMSQYTSTPCNCIPTRFPFVNQCCNRRSPSVCGCPHQRIQEIPLPGIPNKHRRKTDIAAMGCKGQSSQALEGNCSHHTCLLRNSKVDACTQVACGFQPATHCATFSTFSSICSTVLLCICCTISDL